MKFDMRDEINVLTGLIGFFGALIYFMLLIFPVIPGGPNTIIILLVVVSAVTSYLIFEKGKDRHDYSNLLLLPLSASLTAVLYIIGTDSTISIFRHLGIHFGPLTVGMLMAFVVWKIINSDRINFEMKDGDS